MNQNVFLEAMIRKGIASQVHVLRAIRLASEKTSPVTMNLLREAARSLDLSLADLEDLLHEGADIRECRERCSAYLDDLRRADEVLRGLNRYGAGTLAEAADYAADALEYLKDIVDGYSRMGAEE